MEEQDLVLKYWFGEIQETKSYYKTRQRLWFGGDRETDDFIRDNFGDVVAKAAAGMLHSWAATPTGALALAIVLDQFSLNIHRDQAKSFLQSAMAVPLCLDVIRKGWDETVHPIQRVFFYMPLEHSEDMNVQEKSMERFQLLVQAAPSGLLKEVLSGYLRYARLHYDVVKKFGRYPDRNEIMGRTPTAEEDAYMKAGGPPF